MPPYRALALTPAQALSSPTIYRPNSASAHQHYTTTDQMGPLLE
ncbi:hypothetical protein L835_3673 [Mycobacteroides abscessus MAB_110811_1470]|nr:hypothetical protein L835_3673 [Mycobacteroides abscessus MAB_110811_1470]